MTSSAAPPISHEFAGARYLHRFSKSLTACTIGLVKSFGVV